MAAVSPAAAYSPAQLRQLPTPSPFSLSVGSTRWSSRPSVHYSSLFLRFLAILFSFVSVLSLAGLSPKKNGETSGSFSEYPEFMYSFIATILAFIYSAFQLFKGVCDIAHRGILISDMTSDYVSFIFDQRVHKHLTRISGDPNLDSTRSSSQKASTILLHGFLNFIWK